MIKGIAWFGKRSFFTFVHFYNKNAKCLQTSNILCLFSCKDVDLYLSHEMLKLSDSFETQLRTANFRIEYVLLPSVCAVAVLCNVLIILAVLRTGVSRSPKLIIILVAATDTLQAVFLLGLVQFEKGRHSARSQYSALRDIPKFSFKQKIIALRKVKNFIF